MRVLFRKAPTLRDFGSDRWMDSHDSLADSMDQLMEVWVVNAGTRRLYPCFVQPNTKQKKKKSTHLRFEVTDRVCGPELIVFVLRSTSSSF